MKEKIGFYHAGPVADEKALAAVAAAGLSVIGRNADFFTPADIEPFSAVVVGEGKNADAIREAYKAKGVKFMGLDNLEAPEPEKKADEPPFNPDEAPGKAKGKTQGK